MAPIADKTNDVAEEGDLRGDDRRLARVRPKLIKMPENAVQRSSNSEQQCKY